jgi:hypothetical protein
MMTEVLTFWQTGWGVLTGCGVTFLAVTYLFWNWDDAFSKQFKGAVSERLKGLEAPSLDSSVPSTFIHLFDAIFAKRSPDGAPPMSFEDTFCTWHSFYRSAIASWIAVSILYTLARALGIHSGGTFGAVLLMGLLINTVADFFSLLATRLFLAVMRDFRSLVVVLLCLLADVLANLLILLNVTAFVLVFSDILLGEGMDMAHSTIFGGLRNLPPWAPLVSVLSTFFSSIWLWLFALSRVTIQLMSCTGATLKVAKYILPIDERPFRAIGLVAATFAAVGYLLITLL